METEEIAPDRTDIDRTVQLDSESVERLARHSKNKLRAAENEQRSATVVLPERTGEITRSFFRRKASVHEAIVEQYFGAPVDVDEPTLAAVSEEELYDIDRNYTPLGTVAQGGHGKISLYEDRILERQVAVKALHGEFEQNPELRARFIAEAKVTSQLDHPSVPPVHGLLGDSELRLHMVMKMIHGMTLTKYLEQVRQKYADGGVKKYDVRKDLFERLNIFRRVCYAIEYAHGHHIAHRDLKPDNIMIGRYNETYVMDWGIAKTRERMLEKQTDRRLTGTPRYLSPEAVTGDEAWKADGELRRYGWMSGDVYALGLILFELATLSPAYGGETSNEVLRRVSQGEMEPIVNSFGTRIDDDLKAIIRKATASDMRHRYHRIRTLDEDIAKYLRSEEVSARPDNRFRKIVRWGGNHVKLLIFTALVALLAASVASTYVVYSRLQAAYFERRVAIATSQAIQTGEELDTCFDKLNTGLWALGMEARNLLTEQHGVATRNARLREIGNGSAPRKVTAIDLEHIYYLRAPGLAAEVAETDLCKLKVLGESFMRFVLESGNLGGGGDFAVLKADLIAGRQPVSRLFFGLRSGLHIVYPRNYDYPDSYDPRARDWYRKSLSSATPAGTPYWLDYCDVSNGRRMLAGRLVVNGEDGATLGVMAFDVPVTTLYRIIRSQSSFGAASGVLLDGAGRIMPEDGGDPGAVHPAFEEIKRRQFGRCYGKDGKLYLFSRLKAPGWFYVETFTE